MPLGEVGGASFPRVEGEAVDDAATTLRRVEHLIRVADEVRAAMEEARAVVALETTLVAHGFPAPTGIEVGLASDAAVRAAGRMEPGIRLEVVRARNRGARISALPAPGDA